ncbi:thioredoxin domain-containing protein [Crenobacter cavernae]|uniref:Thioredoxin n=1 Tax=Crenobacter cavernae TaxID=2290923 RepID=A0ABY0FD68_9NEIS|nr:thioredoxin family protein [Crenobacter cavernae]RXZ44129.1 thioredoxin [Crenobacter cavernae]
MTRSWRRLDEFGYHATTSANPGVALVLFGQPHCGACKAAKARLPLQLPDTVATLFDVDVAVSGALAHEFELFHLPALALYKNGAFHAWVNAPLEASTLAEQIHLALDAPAAEVP